MKGWLWVYGKAVLFSLILFLDCCVYLFDAKAGSFIGAVCVLPGVILMSWAAIDGWSNVPSRRLIQKYFEEKEDRTDDEDSGG